jgi:hypothetical protein
MAKNDDVRQATRAHFKKLGLIDPADQDRHQSDETEREQRRGETDE